MIYLIYKIHCNITGDDYYGSTKDLNHRMSVHKCNTDKQNSKRACSSKKIINRGDYIVSVVESLDVESKQDALWRERYYIENYPCVNDSIPIQTKEERKQKVDKYNVDNREHILEIHAEYRKTHAKELAEKESARYHANKDKINAKKRAAKYTCEVCGIIGLSKAHRARHEKTTPHQSALAALSTSASIS